MEWTDDIRTELQARREQRAADAYEELFAEVEAHERAEWEAEFDTIPYRSRGADIHRIVMQRMTTLREGA